MRWQWCAFDECYTLAFMQSINGHHTVKAYAQRPWSEALDAASSAGVVNSSTAPQGRQAARLAHFIHQHPAITYYYSKQSYKHSPLPTTVQQTVALDL
jgi:hypothetical protein